MQIDTSLVACMITSQFSCWNGLAIKPVSMQGWDNKTFRLGDDMLVRLPSSDVYAGQVIKEYEWLPKLKSFSTLKIPEPIALGKPCAQYPWHWGIYKWIPGESAAEKRSVDMVGFVIDLAAFLTSLHRIDTEGGPAAGAQSFFRGDTLSVYDGELRKALALLDAKVDVTKIKAIWQQASSTLWQGAPVWVHGDISAGNLILQEGRLAAVIDFGQLAVGDPACDLAIAWTMFNAENRITFKEKLSLDEDTWRRGRAWALWKALIVAAGLCQVNNAESERCWHIINEIITEV